ncbi:MAG: hypothetical protein J6P58_01850 [Oscillospiraceae bacterium]|nr:hypothetical protein [Oscillospiraceae bacterium]
MFRPTALIEGLVIDDPSEDFRTAQRIEQYRVGKAALYIPAGLRWNYIPFSAIRSAGESRRTVSAGHCVTVEIKTPALELETSAGPMTLNLEKPDSLRKLLDAIGSRA